MAGCILVLLVKKGITHGRCQVIPILDRRRTRSIPVPFRHEYKLSAVRSTHNTNLKFYDKSVLCVGRTACVHDGTVAGMLLVR